MLRNGSLRSPINQLEQLNEDFSDSCRVDFHLLYFLIILIAIINNRLKDLFGIVMQANDPVDLFLLPGTFVIIVIVLV